MSVTASSPYTTSFTAGQLLALDFVRTVRTVSGFDHLNGEVVLELVLTDIDGGSAVIEFDERLVALRLTASYLHRLTEVDEFGTDHIAPKGDHEYVIDYTQAGMTVPFWSLGVVLEWLGALPIQWTRMTFRIAPAAKAGSAELTAFNAELAVAGA